MAKRLIDEISICKPWHFIQAEKDWRLVEVLDLTYPIQENSIFLPSTLILGCFQELASWLILYSSQFNLSSSIERIDGFFLMKYRVNPDPMRFEMWAKNSTDNSVVLKGRALMNNKAIALIDSMTLSCVPIQNKEYAEECSSFWNQRLKNKMVG